MARGFLRHPCRTELSFRPSGLFALFPHGLQDEGFFEAGGLFAGQRQSFKRSAARMALSVSCLCAPLGAGNRCFQLDTRCPRQAFRQRTPASGCAPCSFPHGSHQTPSRTLPACLFGGFRSGARCSGFPHCCWTAPSSQAVSDRSASWTPCLLSGFRSYSERGAGNRPAYHACGNRH